MKKLEDRIRKDGIVKRGDVLSVDSFLNHQIDPELTEEMAAEFYRLFKDAGVTRVLTIEASGIAIAIETARYFHVPLVFAKKTRSTNIDDDVWTAPVYSYTHKNTNTIMVSKKYLNSSDCVLIVDDFLANGEAVSGLLSLAEQAGARVAGVGISVEKGYQPGGEKIRARGIHLESLAIIESMDAETGIIAFRE